MPGEIFFAILSAAVGFLEVVERVVKLHIVIDRFGAVLVAHFRVFEDIIGCPKQLLLLLMVIVGLFGESK
ncbi:MAG: hypothetical protein HDS65_05145 [Bacteroidales bacterium]|nr:hypothetical protein [Bacteroidales bacterium]